MGALSLDPMAGTGDCHLGREECRLLGDAKAVIGRELAEGGVSEIAFNRGAQIVQLRLACGVRIDLALVL